MLKSHGCKHVRRMVPKEEEPNPKTLPLDKVVQHIESPVLAYYLEQISIFLRNHKKDLWFPKLSPYLDAFLVRVIRDVQNMKNLLDTFDDNSRAFAIDIIDCLEENEDVYTLTYCYENSRINADILVYKKIFSEKKPKPSEKNSAANGGSKAPDKKTDIPDLDWVKATLKFIRDDSWSVLEYPVMSFTEANTIHSVVRLNCEDVTHLGPLCSTLIEALKNFNRTGELKPSFLYKTSDTVQLSIEKKPRHIDEYTKKLQPHSKNNTKVQQKLDPNKSKTSDTDLETLTKAEKAFIKRKQLIESMDKAFINTALKMILDFVSTEAEASLVFKNADENQCMFIQSACAMAKTPKFHVLFAYDSREILKSISKILAANPWYELKVDVAKVQKDNKLRTVSLVKHPRESYYDEKKSLPKDDGKVEAQTSVTTKRSKSLDRKNLPKKGVIFESGGILEPEKGGVSTLDKDNETHKITNNDEKTPPKPKNDSESTPQKNKDISTSEKENTAPLNTITTNKPTDNSSKTSKTNKTDEKQQTRLSRIDHKVQNTAPDMKRAKSVPPKAIDEEATEKTKDVNNVIDGKGLCMRKLKLLKAMSIPMESDIATRMMRQMGWEGGPLGLRGEGITEPIIPALHLASKAGLGHVKPDNKLPSAFRLEFLQQLLVLITQQQSKYIVELKSRVTNNEKKYIKDILKSFNDRKRINENEEVLKDVIGQIMEEMLCEPDLNLSCGISSDNRYLTLLKEIKTVQTKKTITIPEDRDTIVMKKCIDLPKIITTASLKSIGSHYFTHAKGSNAMKMGLKIVLRYKVMEFMKSDLMEYTVRFDYDLTNKPINFLNDLVQKLNQRTKLIFPTSIEKDMNTETLRHARGTQINFTCEGKRVLIFTKRFAKSYQAYNSKELSDLVNNNNNTNIVDKNQQIKNTKEQENSKDDNTALAIDKNKQIQNVEQPSSKNNSNADSEKNKQSQNTSKQDNSKSEINGEIVDKIKQVGNAMKHEDSQDEIQTHIVNTNEIKGNTIKKEKSKDDVNALEIATNITDDMKNGADNSSDTITDYSFLVKEEITVIDAKSEDTSKNISFELNTDTEEKSVDSLSSSSKRIRSDSENLNNLIKKTKVTESVTYLFIYSKDGDKISNDEVRKFQTAIAQKIDLATNLPMLECHGVENGAIIYGCHNEIGANLIKSVASDMDLTTKSYKKYRERACHKLKIRINSYIGINLKKFFNLIECYNIGISTEHWTVEDVEIFRGYIVISVEVDYESFEHILEANFRLFAGMDRVRVSITWD